MSLFEPYTKQDGSNSYQVTFVLAHTNKVFLSRDYSFDMSIFHEGLKKKENMLH